jgi:hypothetical protein
MTTRNIGEEGFRWFIGVVEDREDPLKLGRVRVRIYNVHSMKQSRVGTDNLPWAVVMSPITGANYNKVGQAPVGIQVGTTVIGFFMDGEDGNNPIIMGATAGIPGQIADNHDVPPEARELNNVNKEQLGPEPGSAYRAKYPYNKVMRTESGHVIEVDDTPNFERIHIYHKSGTYVEINEDGRMVTKTAGDSINVVVKNNEVYIGGSANIQVKGSVNINVDGTVTGKASSWNLTGDVNITGNVAVNGNISSTKQISDSMRTMSADRAIYNSHTHPESIGVVTGTPNGTM